MPVYFSECPEKDLWRELLQYTYSANIERYFNKKEIIAESETKIG